MKQIISVFCLLIIVDLYSSEATFGQSLTLDEIVESYEKVDAIKNYEKQHLEIIDKGKARFNVEVSYTILNSRAYDLTELRVWYDDDLRKLTDFKPCINDIYGEKIKCLWKKDIKDYPAYDGVSFHQNTRFKYVDLHHHEYPYQIVYSYTVELNGLFNLPSWYVQSRENVAVNKAEFSIAAPKDFDFRYTCSNIDLEPEILEDKGRVKYSWKVENLKPIEIEPMGPPVQDQLPILKIAPNEFTISGYDGDASTWNSFGAFNHSLQEDLKTLPPETVQMAKEMVADIENPYEKIKTIYNYVQDNTRYVSIQLGIGGWQPFSPDYVDSNKFGDCKALSHYTHSLLKEVGIPSYYTLINAGARAKSVDPSFSGNQFNHAILSVPVENDTLFLECTSQTSPVNYLGSFTDDRYACIVKPNGGELIKTPAYTKENNYINQESRMQLDDNGNALVQTKMLFVGEKQSYYRNLANYTSKEDQRKKLIESFDIPSFELKEYAFTKNDDNPPCSIELNTEMALRDFASKAGIRYIFAPVLERGKLKVPGSVEDRKHQVVNKRAYGLKETVTVKIPEGFEIENYQTEPQLLESDFGKISSILKEVDATTIEYEMVFEMEKFSLPAERYEDYRSFIQEVNNILNAQVVIKKVK